MLYRFAASGDALDGLHQFDFMTMGVRGLLAWQWSGYPRYHQSCTNLLIHILLVPVFLAGNVAVIAGVIRLSWIEVAAGVAMTMVSLAMQGRGHRGEPVPPEPFSSAGNALGRIFLEQWVTFPRFVLSGRWRRAWQTAPSVRE